MSGESDGWGVRSLLRPGAVLVVLLLLLAASWCRRYARFRRLELAMPGPRSLPVIGSVLEVVNINEDNSLDTLMDLWGGRYSELSRFSIFNHLIVFVTDPDHIAKVLRGQLFHEKADYMYPQMRELIGDGLITSHGARWRHHRDLLQPVFNDETVNVLVEAVIEEADNLVDELRPLAGEDTEYARHLYRCFAHGLLKTNVSTLTQKDKDDIELLISTLQKVLQGVIMRALRPWLWPSAVFYRTTTGREQIKFNKLWSEVIGRIHDGMSALKKEKNHASDIGQTFHFKERKSFVDLIFETDVSEKDVVDEIKTIAGAAVETTSATLSFTLKILSMYPNIQQEMYDEICHVLEGSYRSLRAPDLHRLKLMGRVLKETLRMFPPVPFLARKVCEETEFCGKTIPAHSTFLINVLGLHRDPRHYPEPQEFDPDRFLPEKVADRHPHCFLPFSTGPRNCIGKQLAMMEMKAVLATLLRAYSVHPVHDGITHPRHIPISYGVTLSMLGNVKIRFEPRSSL